MADLWSNSLGFYGSQHIPEANKADLSGYAEFIRIL